MSGKVVKSFLIWGGVLVLVNFAVQTGVQIVFYPFFGENYIPAALVSIVPGLILAWIVGNKVAKDLSNTPGIAKTFGSSFWIGFSVVLVAVLLTSVISYVLLGEFSFGGFIALLAGGYGAKGIKLRN